MSGLIRNLFTLLWAFFRGAADPASRVIAHFWISPLDAGTHVLKSDKYLQLAEAAQLDYLIRTKLMGTLLRRRLQFVNASQLVKFARPIPMFRRVRVETDIVFADEKCAWFSHTLFLGGQQHAEVLVKMKFKKGSLTVPPAEVIGRRFGAKPPHLEAWDRALDAM
ncbi:Thioesterase-like superfamily protein [Polaromonas sp. YR568]|uniref:thioesterase family protein n=1 Tax=Polaromonas sp. YR568 TaxID=1855301 RepID=UPI0008E0A9EA|nr:thioesterase family protein [Polaromonas sp. YR568]SFU86044.1 Thioesterase-like superfamily protein [Polaromonas sp. YR568]